MQEARWALGIKSSPPPYGNGIEVGMLATLLPFPLTNAPFPDNWGNAFRQYRTQMYYSGTIFCLATYLGFGMLLAYRGRRGLLGRNLWLLCAGFALLISLGKPGIVWAVMKDVPLLDKGSNNPFRAMPTFNMFAILAGAVMIERLLHVARRPRVFEIGIAVGVALLMLYHCCLAKSSFYLFADQPYPPMPPAMARLLTPHDSREQGRCISVAPIVSSAPGFPLSLSRGFAAQYSALSFDGYDPLVESRPEHLHSLERMYHDPLGAARAYGIRWLLIDRAIEKPLPNILPHEGMIPNQELLKPLYSASRRALLLPEVEIRELPDPQPIAFAQDTPQIPLPLTLHGTGAVVDLSSRASGGPVIVNFIDWPDMAAYVDGHSAPIEADEWGRVRAMTPAGPSNWKSAMRSLGQGTSRQCRDDSGNDPIRLCCQVGRRKTFAGVAGEQNRRHGGRVRPRPR